MPIKDEQKLIAAVQAAVHTALAERACALDPCPALVAPHKEDHEWLGLHREYLAGLVEEQKQRVEARARRARLANAIIEKSLIALVFAGVIWLVGLFAPKLAELLLRTLPH